MIDVLWDSLLDTLKIFVIVLLVNIVISFIRYTFISKLSKENRVAPLIGSLFGVIPECGVSIISSDLYLKRHITMGTLLAVFLACSDEALPILISDSSKALSLIPMLITKVILGFILGFLVDIIFRKKELNLADALVVEEKKEKEETKLSKHFVHPLLHTLELCAYVLVVNIILGSMLYFIGDDRVSGFLQSNKYLAPLMTSLVGLIPNCASSVLITKLYVINEISFSACLSGLCANAGFGLIILFKNTKNIKKNLLILSILFTFSVFIGYLFSFILGF